MARFKPLDALRATWCASGLSPTERAVLTVLILHADEGGHCWPSQGRLSKNTGLKVRAVQYALKTLEAAKLVTRHVIPPEATRYTLHLMHDAADAPCTTCAETLHVLRGDPAPDAHKLLKQLPDELPRGKDIAPAAGAGDQQEAMPPAPRTEKESARGDLIPQHIVNLWNETCGDVLPRVRDLTPGRMKHIRARCTKPGRDLDWWRDYFQRIRASPFLTGHGNREWKANFDWAIKSDDVITRVLEGIYGGEGDVGNGYGRPPAVTATAQTRAGSQPGWQGAGADGNRRSTRPSFDANNEWFANRRPT